MLIDVLLIVISFIQFNETEAGSDSRQEIETQAERIFLRAKVFHSVIVWLSYLFLWKKM